MSANKTHRKSAAMRGLETPPRSAQCPQRVVVLGGGIIGLSTAYYLAKRGHEVLCIEKESQVGMLASFKNGSFFDSTLYSSWADFSAVYRKQTHSTKSKKSAFRIEAAAWMDPAFWAWGLKFMKNSTSRRAKENGRKIRDLGFYSQRKLQELIRMHPELEEAMEQTAQGTLELFESTGERDEVMHSDRIFHCLENRIPLQPLEAGEAACLEPALNPKVLSPGAMYSSTGTNGDVHKTCVALWNLCRQQGVMFRFDTEITDILVVDNHVVAVQAQNGDLIEGDSFVLALGNNTPRVARLAGVKLPMYPVKGYVLSVPRNTESSAPPLQCNVYAGGNALVSPMRDNTMRISGGADFAGFNYKSDPKRVAWLFQQAKALFPDNYFDESKLESHVCLRPVSADDVPFIGQTMVENLYVNSGHGSKGWTLSFGSAALLADHISGRTPEINIEKFSPLRFGLFR
ncbi:D-amino acid dehydrogenase small subunit [Thraustotheca clavata]|uniref:D-amino acid dehydrogenase small subunit n=1 Tax=Thraustotheca clavata TaxID=74557 RepID=A0A1V9Y8K9_9STRA|nr:D-amino acid dehydrogenase small subunit [Thraustotheca clavata]